MYRLDIRRRIAAARRRGAWRLAQYVVGFAFVGLLCGAAVASQLATGVVAQVSVLVTPQAGNAFFTREGSTFVALETEAEVARSDEVLQRVAARSSPSIGVDELRRRVRARPVSNADVIVISVRGRTGRQAVSLAQSVADTTLDVRRERTVAAYKARATTLQTYVAEAEGDLERAAGPGGDPGQVATLSRRANGVRSALRDVTGPAPSAGQVIDASVASESGPTGRRPGTVAASSALGAAIGLWWGRSQLPRRLRHVPGRASSRNLTVVPLAAAVVSPMPAAVGARDMPSTGGPGGA